MWLREKKLFCFRVSFGQVGIVLTCAVDHEEVTVFIGPSPWKATYKRRLAFCYKDKRNISYCNFQSTIPRWVQSIYSEGFGNCMISFGKWQVFFKIDQLSCVIEKIQSDSKQKNLICCLPEILEKIYPFSGWFSLYFLYVSGTPPVDW
jgi:hypothetical protein